MLSVHGCCNIEQLLLDQGPRMRLIAWDSLFLLLLIGDMVNGHKVLSCDRIFQIKCTAYEIVILKNNATAGLYSEILEQCNAHHQCTVNNTYEECVEVEFWCRMDSQVLEMEKSLRVILNSKSPLMSLMSENFREGGYSDTQNIICSLYATEQRNNTMMTMKLRIYEFTLYDNCGQFCLNWQKSSFCTKSRIHYEIIPAIEGQGFWKFDITLNSPVNCVPKGRFWIELHVSGDLKDPVHKLQCKSSSGPITISSTSQPDRMWNEGSFGKNMISVLFSLLGGLLILLVLVTVAAVMYVMRRPSSQLHIPEQIYSNIDTASIEDRRIVPQPNIGTRNLVPEISLAMQALDNLCHGSTYTITTPTSIPRHHRDKVEEPNIQDEVDDQSLAAPGDIDIIDNDVYGSQMNVDDESKMFGNCAYGSCLTIKTTESNDSAAVEIEDNAIYGSEISDQNLNDATGDTETVENAGYDAEANVTVADCGMGLPYDGRNEINENENREDREVVCVSTKMEVKCREYKVSNVAIEGEIENGKKDIEADIPDNMEFVENPIDK